METERVRLDKWLWAARFFKTRSAATQAVSGGAVHIAGGRAKPGRAVRVGDRLEIRKGTVTFDLEVVALGDRRGPASEARELYRETEESRLEREKTAAQKRSSADVVPVAKPGKRDRRALERLRGRSR